jgi:DNA repair protein RAD57
VTDTWEKEDDDDRRRPVAYARERRPTGELLYADQARIFGSYAAAAEEQGGVRSKSAALGLVWANQVNARIMFSRTARRRHHHRHHAEPVPPRAEGHDGHERKRLRVAEGGAGAGGVVRLDGVGVRRLTVMFSSVCAPASVDFVVTSRGVETLADDDVGLGVVTAPGPSPPSMTTLTVAPPAAVVAVGAGVGVARPPLADVSPLDVGSVASDFQPTRPGDIPVGEVEDDEDAYWREMDDFPFAGDSVDVTQGSDPS